MYILSSFVYLYVSMHVYACVKGVSCLMETACIRWSEDEEKWDNNYVCDGTKTS